MKIRTSPAGAWVALATGVVSACGGGAAGSAGPEADAASADSATEARPLRDGAGGSGEDGGPPADTYISATLGPHRDPMGNNLCPEASPQSVLEIGSPTTAPVTVANGDSFQGAAVSVVCVVAGGFTISLQAAHEGGGNITISGQVSTIGGDSIRAQIGFLGTPFTESDCTIAYTYMGNPVPTTPVASGRIWGHLSCPSMMGVQQLVVNGSAVVEQCDGEADFLFENCGQ